ncbi:hypothetical protein ANO11243_030210 [Dothideomycetidae sp. 11243]|nr:hypothetical protein ANO11243_030210 [fungal sp. No.11243]
MSESSEEEWVTTKYTWPTGAEIHAKDFIFGGLYTSILQHPRSPNKVLKGPLVEYTEQDNGSFATDPIRGARNQKRIDREAKAYERVAGIKGVVGFHGLEYGCISLDYHPIESLDMLQLKRPEYLPPIDVRLKWMTDAIRIVAACHEARVLWIDIALRNFVVAADQTLRGIDFCDAYILPITTDMATANIDGLTVKHDLFYLANALYSIATWTHYENVVGICGIKWPAYNEMPGIEGVPLGYIIRACWERRISSAQDMLKYCMGHKSRRRLKSRYAVTPWRK